jgi:hypothetical protein
MKTGKEENRVSLCMFNDQKIPKFIKSVMKYVRVIVRVLGM